MRGAVDEHTLAARLDKRLDVELGALVGRQRLEEERERCAAVRNAPPVLNGAAAAQV